MNDSLSRYFSRLFLQGLVVIAPLVLTAAVLYWLGASLEHALAGVLRALFPRVPYEPGMGIATGVLLTFAAGLGMRVWGASRLLEFGERVVDRIPLAKTIYAGARDFIRFASQPREARGMDKVVLVSLGGGVRAVGFVTGAQGGPDPGAHDGEDYVAVYLQMSYQLGGYTVFVPRAQVQPLDMKFEDAMRWVITAGVSSRNGAEAARASAD